MSLGFTPWFSSFPLLSALCSSPPPSSCREAPHSFPHSHFHFPALGFASTLSSASFAQMTSNKATRDAPIRLYSWCLNEAMRDRGVSASRLFVSGICHWSGETWFALGRFSARLNSNVSLQNVIRFCSHRRCHVDAYFTWTQFDQGIWVFDTSLRTGSTSGEPALSFAVDSSAPGRRAGSGAFPDRAGMKASLQASSAPAKGWGIPCLGPTAAQGRRQRQGRAAARQPSGASSLRPGLGRPPWHSLQGLGSGRVTRVQPAGQEGRVLPDKLKESGRVERSFVWKDDAGKACNLGIT